MLADYYLYMCIESLYRRIQSEELEEGESDIPYNKITTPTDMDEIL